MNTLRFRIAALSIGLAAAPFAFGAGALTPQSFIDGNPQTKTDTQLYSVRIVAVDGDIQHENPAAVLPGPHWLEIAGPPGAAHVALKTQTVVLKIQPCTYYYLGARKTSAAIDQWKLVVDAEETITACNPADELKKAQAAAKANPPKASPASSH